MAALFIPDVEKDTSEALERVARHTGRPVEAVALEAIENWLWVREEARAMPAQRNFGRRLARKA
jgi:hypothetical protein